MALQRCCAAALLALLLALAATPAHSTHFRFATISWRLLQGRTVRARGVALLVLLG